MILYSQSTMVFLSSNHRVLLVIQTARYDSYNRPAYRTKARFSLISCFFMFIISDDSVIALANNCLHLRSLDLYYCQNITDRAMYSLAQSRAKSRHEVWAHGLTNLNISQCTALTPPAVQAVCDSFPALHTCPGRHSLIISGCLHLTSVHCACSVQAHRVPHLAH